MKLSKEYIMALSALILMLGGLAGGYQFYYKERLAQYQANIAQEKKLEDTLNGLEATFHSTKPDILISAISGQVVPIKDELQRRAQFFNINDMQLIEPIPEGKMLGFYYRDEFNRLYAQFREEALKRFPTCYYPDSTFGAPRPDEFTGVAVAKPQVETALKKITLGLNIMRMLMEAKAVYITDVQLWPPRTGNPLSTDYVVGMSFSMATKDIVAFLDKLRTGDRYVHVNGLRVQNQYLRWPSEPPLNVQLLVTFQQSKILDQQNGSAEAGAVGSDPSAKAALEQWKLKGGGGFGMRRDRDDDDDKKVAKPKGAWGKFTNWLKNLW